ncbi:MULTISPECIES: bZIP transcription factor [unclassified Neorhizobium]|uniref:bZIP transcription factor n=1 Tax=unclassified Neorhizobium TaxID=2629175 RepID=UPI001FF58A4D|nr:MULTISPECIES: bZIP transcription factor [unclassified Neorhizobium]MCJ9672014.1 hypothetical protein [Neorhizobium sp. SHOUNA12B]MCJ9747944.1 hypothetical protein [Neorhizobium sp. SHOUNA12A]
MIDAIAQKGAALETELESTVLDLARDLSREELRQLTDDQRTQRRLQRNKQAAFNSRQRQKENAQNLNQRNEELKLENQALRHEVAGLRKFIEKHLLEGALLEQELPSPPPGRAIGQVKEPSLVQASLQRDLEPGTEGLTNSAEPGGTVSLAPVSFGHLSQQLSNLENFGIDGFPGPSNGDLHFSPDLGLEVPNPGVAPHSMGPFSMPGADPFGLTNLDSQVSFRDLDIDSTSQLLTDDFVRPPAGDDFAYAFNLGDALPPDVADPTATAHHLTGNIGGNLFPAAHPQPGFDAKVFSHASLQEIYAGFPSEKAGSSGPSLDAAHQITPESQEHSASYPGLAASPELLRNSPLRLLGSRALPVATDTQGPGTTRKRGDHEHGDGPFPKRQRLHTIVDLTSPTEPVTASSGMVPEPASLGIPQIGIDGPATRSPRKELYPPRPVDRTPDQNSI